MLVETKIMLAFRAQLCGILRARIPCRHANLKAHRPVGDSLSAPVEDLLSHFPHTHDFIAVRPWCQPPPKC